MMIRINLLPVRQVKKRAMGQQVLVLFAAVVLLALVINYLWLDNRQKEKQRGLDQIAATQRQIAELEKVIGEVNNINKRKAEVEEKLRVLNDLKKGRSGPVKFMDALATATPQKVWILTFEESGNAVKLTGNAQSHEDVADFMRSLSSMVWTPKGMGRLVEQKREGTNSRVELLGDNAQIEDFPVGQVSFFFSNIELTKAQQVSANLPGVPGGGTIVTFEITFGANYTI